jgi:hypothetical protein
MARMRTSRELPPFFCKGNLQYVHGKKAASGLLQQKSKTTYKEAHYEIINPLATYAGTGNLRTTHG